MSQAHLLTSEERQEIEDLITSFNNHGCGLGLDMRAQLALRRLLDALDEANRNYMECQQALLSN